MNYFNANNGINNNTAVSTNISGATSTCTNFGNEGDGGGGGSIGMGSIGMDMMAVATRIQERARILTEERRKVQETDEVLTDLRRTLDKEKTINSRRRKHLLERINERNNVELEIFETQDTIDDNNRNVELFNQQRIESEERIKNLLKERTEEAVSFYGPNLAQMESYVKALEKVVLSKERVREQRRQRLETIRNEFEKAKTEEENIRQETDTIREDIRCRKEGDTVCGPVNDTVTTTNTNATTNSSIISSSSNERIGRDIEEIAVLSKRVREIIEQRSDLRKKRKLARQEYNKANEEMLKWEEKRITMTLKQRR
mmetsp:Transcript_43533/g.49294  ORF Transcript_43533/g.49294 Transcript_43533/m.49294 type:complete len:315 (+) Transcript_43533:82-1026(+)